MLIITFDFLRSVFGDPFLILSSVKPLTCLCLIVGVISSTIEFSVVLCVSTILTELSTNFVHYETDIKPSVANV